MVRVCVCTGSSLTSLTEPHNINQHNHSQPQWLQRCAKSWGLLEEAKAVAMAKKDQELAFQKAELAAAVEVWGMDWAGMAAAAPYNGSLCVSPLICVCVLYPVSIHPHYLC